MSSRRLRARGLVVVLAVGLLAACNPNPGTGPTSTPTAGSPSASPSSTPTPTPTENAQEREQREAFEAAEKAYREAFAEVGRLSREGGAEKPSAKLAATATGKYLSSQMDQLNWLSQNKSRTSADGSVGWVELGTFSARQVTLTACEDFRKVLIVDSSGKSTAPEGVGSRVYKQRLTVDLKQGSWKVSRLDTLDQLEGCE